jgi:hypothetical protein
VGGSLNLVFGILFWAAPALTTALMAFPIGGPAPEKLTLVMNGWGFAFLGVVLAAHVPVLAAQSVLLFVAMLIFCVAVALLAALNLHVPAVQIQEPWPMVGWLAGWLIGVAGLLMTYMGVAAMLVAVHAKREANGATRVSSDGAMDHATRWCTGKEHAGVCCSRAVRIPASLWPSHAGPVSTTGGRFAGGTTKPEIVSDCNSC